LAGINAAALAAGDEPSPPPRETALGSLIHYITRREQALSAGEYHLRSLAALATRLRDRKERHRQQCELALREFHQWQSRCCGQIAEPWRR